MAQWDEYSPNCCQVFAETLQESSLKLPNIMKWKRKGITELLPHSGPNLEHHCTAKSENSEDKEIAHKFKFILGK